VEHVCAGLVDRADHGGVVGPASQPVQRLHHCYGGERVQPRCRLIRTQYYRNKNK
jgi:hypothetical protein